MSSCVLSRLYLLSLFSFHSGPSLALSYTGPNSPSGVSGALNMVRADLTLISQGQRWTKEQDVKKGRRVLHKAERVEAVSLESRLTR